MAEQTSGVGDPTALLQSPAFWRTVADSVPDLMLIVDADGRILFVNRVPAGVRREELVGTSVLQFVPAASRDVLSESLREIFSGGLPRRREQQGLLADGSTAWYSTHTSAVVHEGRIAAAVIIARDITERRRAQLALVESEARFRTLVEHAPEAIVVYDMDGERFVEANRNACELFEMPLSRLLLSSPADLSPERQPDGRESHLLAGQYLNQALEGSVLSFEWVHRSSTGKERRCEVRLVRLPSERRLVRGSIIDRTEQIRLDEQLAEWQKMDALGQLAAGIAHDFNNVLAVVGATAEMIENAAEITPSARADAQTIRAEANRGAALTSQLLAFSRRQKPPCDHVDLNEIAGSLIYALQRVVPRGIKLVNELHDEPLSVFVHRSQVEQVLVNLVLNARDAIEGEGTIIVSSERGEHGAVLRVKDDGAGMDEETRRRAMEPFFTTKAPGAGTGLGLATVHMIVKGASGCVGIESEPGSGTTVTIALPMSPPEHCAA